MAVTEKEKKKTCIICGSDMKISVGYICNECRDKIIKPPEKTETVQDATKTKSKKR